MASPETQLQPQPSLIPPKFTVNQLISPELIQPPVDQVTLASLEQELNRTKHTANEILAQRFEQAQVDALAYRKYLAEQSAQAAATQYRHLLEQLRGRLAPYLVNESLKTIVLEALGPLGDAFRGLETARYKLTPSQKNLLLNPDAIYYYLRSLPDQGAFKLMMLPFRAGFQILAYGGGPFTKVFRTTEPTWNPYIHEFMPQVVTKTVFTPFLFAAEKAGKLADFVDKSSGWDTLTHISEERHQFDRIHKLDNTYQQYKEAKKNYLSTLIIGDEETKTNAKKKLTESKKNLSATIKTIDGPFWQQVRRKALIHTAKNLRRTERDPLSYLAVLLGNLIWDATLGLIANFARVAVTRALGMVPGFNILRARLQTLFQSHPWITTTRMGLINIQHFAKATFSLSTASSFYLGYLGGSALFPNATVNVFGLPVNAGGLLGGTLLGVPAIFYKTALLHATTGPFVTTMEGIVSYPGLGPVPEIIHWTNQVKYGNVAQYRWDYQAYYTSVESPLQHGQPYYQYLEGKLGQKLASPGPINRFASWLWKHPYFRLPIVGSGVGFALAPFLEKYLGIPPWVSIPSSMALDWLWQVKGTLASDAIGLFKQTRLWGWYYSKVYLPVNTYFSNLVYEPFIAETTPIKLGTPIFRTLRPWSNTLARYFGNFLNPGFFAGLGLIPMMTPVIGAWGYVLGPLTGSAMYLLGSRALVYVAQSVGIKSIGGIAIKGVGAYGLNALPKINAWSWLGMTIGVIIDIIIPGSQAWLTIGLTYGLPVVLTFFPGLTVFFGKLLAGLVTNISYFAYQAVWAMGISSTAYAAGLAAAATGITIAAIAGLTIFSGFVLYSSFWVPLVEESKAGPQSTYFSINSSCSQLPNNNYQCCSSFDITQPLFNRDNYLAHFFDLSASSLVVDLSDPAKTTDAFRRLPQQRQVSLNYVSYPNALTTDDYTIATTTSIDVQFYSNIQSFLSVPFDQQADLFTFINQDLQLYRILQPFIELLQKAAPDVLEDKNPKYYFKELEAQLKLFRAKKKYLGSLVGKIKIAAESINIEVIIAELNKAKNINTTNPLVNPSDPSNPIPCPSDNQRCLEYKDNMQGYYDSWNYFLDRYSVENYLNQAIAIKNLPETDLGREKQLASLKEQLANFHTRLLETIDLLDQQITLVNQIKDMVDKIYDNLSDEDANFILSLNPYNLASLSHEDKAQLEKILSANFGEIFSGNYFYIPQGTNYKVCLEAEFRGQAGQPQTVCSTISASQSFWAQTNFAKSCTTFTP